MNSIAQDKQIYYKNLLFLNNKTKNNLVKNNSEYRDQYDGERLYNMGTVEQYVSKKIQDESEFWKGGKYAYDDKKLKENVIYQTTKRQDHCEHHIPEKFSQKNYNMRKTRISEYSNALYNNHVSLNIFLIFRFLLILISFLVRSYV